MVSGEQQRRWRSFSRPPLTTAPHVGFTPLSKGSAQPKCRVFEAWQQRGCVECPSWAVTGQLCHRATLRLHQCCHTGVCLPHYLGCARCSSTAAPVDNVYLSFP